MTGIVRGLFGGRSRAERTLGRFRPISFEAPGGTGRFDPRANIVSFTRGAPTERVIGELRSTLGAQAGEIRALRPLVSPGFGRLTEARVGALRTAERRTIGDLRENLARRRVLGSSFAQAATTRARAEFAEREGVIRGESFLQELALTTQLIEREFAASTQAVASELTQLNFETSLAAQQSNAASAAVQANLTAQAQAAAAQEGGAAEFLGTVIGAFLTRK